MVVSDSAWMFWKADSETQELYLPDAEKGGAEYAVLGAQKSLQLSEQRLAFWDVGPTDAEGMGPLKD